MEGTATAIVVTLLFILVFFAGSIWLQIFLSRQQNKWPGLIIPIICFMISIITVLSLSMYTVTTDMTVTEIVDMNDGEVTETIHEENINTITEKPSFLSMLATVIPVFLIFNIPTLIFIAIYFASREKLKLRKELDKMNVQDLD